MLNYDQVTPVKTYANETNAHAAVKKVFGNIDEQSSQTLGSLRYTLAYTKEGRVYPIFLGQNAVSYGVHFHFNVVG